MTADGGEADLLTPTLDESCDRLDLDRPRRPWNFVGWTAPLRDRARGRALLRKGVIHSPEDEVCVVREELPCTARALAPGVPTMSSGLREQAVERILRDRLSAIIRTADRELAADAMRAAVAGGFRLVEFTLTAPGAYELISEFAGDDRLLVGAGTVLTVAQARDAWNAGARFLVSPVCDPAAIGAAGVGFVKPLFRPGELASRDLAAVERRAKRIHELLSR